MPLISVTLPDVTQSVFRPMVIGVTQQIKKATKISEDVPIFFGNEVDQIQTAGSGLDNKDDRLMRSETLRRFEVKTSEEYAVDQQVTDLTGASGNTRIFEDKELDAWLSPSYTSQEVTLELAFITKSKEEASRWRADVTSRYLRGRQNLHHDIEFSMNLPLPAWEVINQLHSKREKIGGYGQSLNEYLIRHSTNQLTVISDHTGKNKQFTFAEKQMGIQGYFQFTNEPDKTEYDSQKGLYTIRFSYKFVYQKPSMVDIKYPVIVHQQLLDPPFIEFVNKGHRPDDREIVLNQWQWGTKQLTADSLNLMLRPKIPYIRIPFQDDFSLTYTFPGTGTYLLILLQQQNGEKEAVNLRELGSTVKIDKEILDWLADGEYKYVGRPGGSILRFDLYRGNQLCRMDSIELDKDLNLNFTIPVDVRKEYRIRCSLCTDMTMMDQVAMDRLMQVPRVFMKIFGSINELLNYSVDFQDLGKQRRIYPWQLSRLYQAILGQGTFNIKTGTAMSYGTMNWGTNIQNTERTFLSDIPEHLIRKYRSTRVSKYDQQVFGICSFNRELTGN